jgi:hypothetical protein
MLSEAKHLDHAAATNKFKFQELTSEAAKKCRVETLSPLTRINPKHEARNPKQIKNPNDQNSKL